MKDYDPHLSTIEEFLKDRVFVVPVYQRPYSWGKEEVSELLDDMLEVFQDEEENTSLFLGTTYVKNRGLRKNPIYEYELIDGQQRILTISFIFIAIYTLLASKEKEYIHEIQNIKNILWKYANRENDHELKLIYSNSIEKEMLQNIFEQAYSDCKKLRSYIKNYSTETKIEENIRQAINRIFKFLTDNFQTNEKLLDFTDFILRRVNLIFIETTVSNPTIFKIFEAINSKGKKLEEIDLIKTYIFSKIDEDDHERYLNKWGYLIKETDDKLEDYLWVYVKAFIKYYVYSIKIRSFKALVSSDAKEFYNLEKESDILKALIDDLVKKVKFYKALYDKTEFEKIIKNKKQLLQFNIFSTLKYEHPKPILLKAYYEYDKSSKTDKDKENLYKIMRALNSYMIIYQTMNKRDSKDSIGFIQDALVRYYNEEKINGEYLENWVGTRLLNESLDLENFKQKFREIEGYKKSGTDIGFVLLAIHESYDERQEYFSDDRANAIFDVKNKLEIDHLLVQKPKKESEFKYYSDKRTPKDEILILKEGHDFPSSIVNGMPYENFKIQILNKMGNLRLWFGDENAKRGRDELDLKDNIKLTQYRQTQERLHIVTSNVIASDVIYIPDETKVKNIYSREEDKFTLDWEDVEKVHGNKPILIKIKGKDSKEVNSNRTLIGHILGYLYSLDPEIIESLEASESDNDDKKPNFSKDKNKLRYAINIKGSNIYFEANKNAIDLINFIKDMISNKYKLNLKDFEVIYRVE